MNALTQVNYSILAPLFGQSDTETDLTNVWANVLQSGRFFGDISIQTYNAQANPNFHYDGCCNILTLSITLGTIWRWFIAKVYNDMRTLPLDKGSAYFASPCLFEHGTWSPKVTPPSPAGTPIDSTLAIHFRPLLYQTEQHIIEKAKTSAAYTNLLQAIQLAIKDGDFRLPCMHEALMLQLPTLRKELTEITEIPPKSLTRAKKRKKPDTQPENRGNHQPTPPTPTQTQ